MVKILASLFKNIVPICLIILAIFCMKDVFAKGGLIVSDLTNQTYPYNIIFPNATVIDNGDGTTSVETGTGGSGSGTVNGTTNYVAKFTNTTVVGNSTIFDNGNVGIGTTSPQAKLGVVGDIIADLNTSPATSSLAGTAISARGANNSQVRIGTSSYGAAGVGAFSNRHANGTAASPSAVTTGNILLNMEGWGYGATNWSVAPRVMLRGYASQTWNDTQQASYMSMWTTPTDSVVPAERMRIIQDGNVGIGTTAPAGILHVKTGAQSEFVFDEMGAVNPRITLWRNDTSISSDNFIGSLSFAGSDNTGQVMTTHAAIRSYADGIHASGDNPTRLSFYTTPDNSSTMAEVVTMKNSGNVGIGTTAPLFLLDVAGTTSVNSLNVNDAYTLPTADGTNTYVLKTNGAGTVSWAADSTGTNYFTASGNDIYNNNSGNVGIGTTAPVAKIHLLTSTGNIVVNPIAQLFLGGAEVDCTDLGAGTALDSYVKALLQFNTTSTYDAVGVIPWSANGNATLDTGTKKFGASSLKLDGTDDYLETPDSADFDMGSGDFTIEMWVKMTSLSTLDRLCGQVGSGADNGSASFYAQVNAGQVTASYFASSPPGTSYAATSTTGIPNTTAFHHIAFVRYGSTMTIYIDGQADGSVNVGSTSMNASTAVWALGRNGAYNDANEFDGYIDEFKIDKGIARYTGNFTPPTSEYVTSAGYHDNTGVIFTKPSSTTAIRTVSNTGSSEVVAVHEDYASFESFAQKNYFDKVVSIAGNTAIGTDSLVVTPTTDAITAAGAMTIAGNVGIGSTTPSTTYNAKVTGTFNNTTSAYLATASGNVGMGTTAPAYKLDVIGTSRFGTTSNHTSTEADGTLLFTGDATTFEDLRVSGSQARAGSSSPSLAAFGPSGSLRTWQFDSGQHDELEMEIQIPHSWKTGGRIYPHIHWTPVSATAGNVVWQLDYSWADINGTFGAPTTMTTDATAAGGTAWVHKMTSFKDGSTNAYIDGSGKGISSMLVLRVHRDAGVGSDTLAANTAFLEMDIHYEQDTTGSRTETGK